MQKQSADDHPSISLNSKIRLCRYSLKYEPIDGTRITVYITKGSQTFTVTFTANNTDTMSDQGVQIYYNGDRTFDFAVVSTTQGIPDVKINRIRYTRYIYAYGFDRNMAAKEVCDFSFIKKTLADSGGRFIKYEGIQTITANQIKEVSLTAYDIVNIFGTQDTSKIHILSTSMYRVSDNARTAKSWSNAYFYNSSANVTYTIPYIELFNPEEYIDVDDRLARVFLYNQNLLSGTEEVRWRVFAFVED